MSVSVHLSPVTGSKSARLSYTRALLSIYRLYPVIFYFLTFFFAFIHFFRDLLSCPKTASAANSRYQRPESATISRMSTTDIAANVSKLLDRVRSSAENCHRGNSDILVLAVSKTRPPEDIRAAHAAGLDHFGENYVQEAVQKVTDLRDLSLTWHFIGPIQSNKTRDIAENFDWVHSLERLKIARRLNDQRPRELPPIDVCIQVNISGEDSKSGIPLADVDALAREVVELPRLRLRGLMGVPAAGSDDATLHSDFSRLRASLEQLQSFVPTADTLSIGMSADMDIAIAEGSTIVRIGTAIFGPRER